VATPTQADPAAQAKASKVMAVSMVVGGALIGISLPAYLYAFRIEVFMTASGFDLIWLVPLAVMIIDFAMGWFFWRRASAIERSLQGLPPRS
jgi:hypothetical protein